MKLSIIITHYTEPWRIVKPMFDSLALQKGINWNEIEILLVQDGSESPLERNQYIEYGLPVMPLTIAHSGVAAARNFGLYAADGDYVMFCDCDDMFCQAFALNMFLSAIKDEPDIIYSPFIEESEYQGYRLFRHENDMCFVHGKAFNRQFLLNNGLKFPEHVKKHEDGAFVRLAFLLTDNTAHIATPLYTWVWNPESVMRRNGLDDELVDSYPELIKSRIWFLDALVKRGHKELNTQAAKLIFDTYYDFQKSEFSHTGNQDKIHEAAIAFKELYQKYKEAYLANDGTVLARLANQARQEAYTAGMQMEQLTIGQFLSMIEQM